MKRPHLMTINNKLSVNDPHHMKLPRLPAFIIVLVVLTSSRQDPMLHPRSSVYFRTSVELHRRGLWTRSLTCGSRFGVFSLRFHLLMARISLTLIICFKIHIFWSYKIISQYFHCLNSSTNSYLLIIVVCGQNLIIPKNYEQYGNH